MPFYTTTGPPPPLTGGGDFLPIPNFVAGKRHPLILNWLKDGRIRAAGIAAAPLAPHTAISYNGRNPPHNERNGKL